MTRTFVAINDAVHHLVRNITRHVPLCPCPSADGPLVFEYRFQPRDLPEDYYTLAAFHSVKGRPLEEVWPARRRVRGADKPAIPQQANYFDIVRLDRRCTRDLRLKLRKNGPGMVSADLLAFGTGMLRARNDDVLEPLQEKLWHRYGRLTTRHEVVFATIRALHWNSLPLFYQSQKESYDSTNLIYGDALGELEQLWDRRADTAFLDRVALSLQRMRKQPEIAAFYEPPMNLDAVLQHHRRAQGLWKTPPATGRALLRRVETILNNVVIECAPHTAYSLQELREAPPSFPATQAADLWQSDASGYDGWLSGGDGR
jgi:hypothetical protein